MNGHRVVILTTSLGDRTSGQSRFVSNLSLGLVGAGVQVTVCALTASDEAVDWLRNQGVQVVRTYHHERKLLTDISSLSLLNLIGKKLARLSTLADPPDDFIVLSDEAIAAGSYLSGARRVFISQGDIAFLYLNRSFYRTGAVLKAAASLQAAPMLLRSAAYARSYDLLLGNSRFTADLMSFIYGVPFGGYIYPPVRLDIFSPPRAGAQREPFGLALVRSATEQNIDLLEAVAREASIKTVGGDYLNGATTLGRISDVVLAEFYRESSAVILPRISEPFGYAAAEGICCGTPVVCFASGGPLEQVSHGSTGWLARSRVEFVRLAIAAIRGDITLSRPIDWLSLRERYDPLKVAKDLLNLLEAQ